MRLPTSSLRLVRSTLPSSTNSATLSTPAYVQRRCASSSSSSEGGFWEKFFPKKKEPIPVDHMTERFLKSRPAQQKMPEFGSLSESSILEDESIAGPKGDVSQPKGPPRDPRVIAAALDPEPERRRKWEAKMVMQEIRKRGRMTPKQQLKQQEREILSKSHYFQTSTKKLMFLARQIQGKPVDEAILQMRFSVKKVAKDVKHHLEHARNEAIVRKGMGLGRVNGETGPVVNIKTKDGKRLKIDDRTRLYVDQAWVGKGHYGITPDHRARGQINRMKNPTAYISVILKEEATRVRLHGEREAKEERRTVWTQLPNRPVTTQRQYYSW